MTQINPLSYWLAALYLPHVGPITIQQWLTRFKNIQALFTASTDELQAKGLSSQQIAAIKHPAWQAIEQDLKWQQANNQHIISLEDPDYPPLLKAIHAPPIVLFVQGDKAILKQMQLAIVGSRRPSHSGIKHAREFAHTLAALGWVITSGLAIGIDSASHEGALEAVYGGTIAIMGTGLSHCYPKQHRKLAQCILRQQGALVSEFPLNTLAKPQNFPRRNRLISGMSMGVLIVEAALQSGSLITARHALEQGREVFALPGSIEHPLARGCHQLIRQGAKLVETISDITEEFIHLPPLPQLMDPFTPPLSPTDPHILALPQSHQTILNYMQYDITTIDTLIMQSGLTATEVSSILLILELQNYIEVVTGGYKRMIYPPLR